MTNNAISTQFPEFASIHIKVFLTRIGMSW